MSEKDIIIKDFKQFLIDKDIIDIYISGLHYDLIDELDDIIEKENIENKIEKILINFCNKEK